MDSRARHKLSSLGNELTDVQRIMIQNIDDVMQRGAIIDGEHRVYTYIDLFSLV